MQPRDEQQLPEDAAVLDRRLRAIAPRAQAAFTDQVMARIPLRRRRLPPLVWIGSASALASASVLAFVVTRPPRVAVRVGEGGGGAVVERGVSLAARVPAPVPEGLVPSAVPGTPPPPSEAERAQLDAVARAADPGDAPVRGNPNAPVTMVVYSDFQCPFCARLAATLPDLQSAFPTELRIAFRNMPLPFHLEAVPAAEAGREAHAQGKFWQWHDRLFALGGVPTWEVRERIAREVGMDVSRLRAALDRRVWRAAVEGEMRIGQAAGVTGTPSAFINGTLIVGAQPLEAFKSLIQTELDRPGGLRTGRDSRKSPPEENSAVVE